MVTCYIGLGSNLGKREENIKSALAYIESMRKARVINLSRFYETEPQGGPADSPRFINAVAKIRTELSPVKLFRELKILEARLGRKDTKRFGPRIIDLDILFYANKRINLPFLKIPHPNLRERDFVLKPLKEVAPAIIRSLSKEMKIIPSIAGMRKFVAREKAKNKTIGLVPTMGYLHRGHLSLIKQAKKDCAVCVVSVFVNPLQFGPKEDYRIYPRDLGQDSILAKSAGCDCLFYPEAKDMYPVRNYSATGKKKDVSNGIHPKEHLTYVNVEKLTDCLCGLSRPGHFKGVATVVAKLFNAVQPDIAYFGQKDYQQALVIRKMAQDLNFNLTIKVMPIVREADGLAMSSRNTYLNNQERREAVVLSQSLRKARSAVLDGERNSNKIIAKIKNEIIQRKSAKIDYIAVVDAQTLEPLEYVKGKTLIALAVWIGKTRLIDNIVLH